MFLNVKAVKNHLKEGGKQISKEGIEALNFRVRTILNSSIINVGRFTRIGEAEINHTK